MLKPVFVILRCEFGYSCLGYIDGSFYTEDTLHRCQEATFYTVELLIKLGFVVHATKSFYQPTQSLEFLGIVLESILMKVTIPEVKVDKILALCRSLLAKRLFTISHVASHIGTLASTFLGVELGPLYFRRLELDKDIALQDTLGDFEGLRYGCFELLD